MANKKIMRHASGRKALRHSIVRQAANVQVRSRVKTLTAHVIRDIKAKNVEAAKTSFKIAQAAWQKAAKRNIVSRNAASRKIARLASQIAALTKKS